MISQTGGQRMVRFGSIFSQLLNVFSRPDFERSVKDHQAQRYSKGFSSWHQFVSMLFCHLAQAKSLREICNGLACCEGKLRHLGVPDAPSRSTLSYANSHRPWELYESVFYQLLDRCKLAAPGKPKRFRFRNKLLSLDSSTIDLCLSLFPWAKFRQTKGAIKLHLLLDHDGYLPTWAWITEGKKHDVKAAQGLHLPKGSVVALDRGYNDYSLFGDWCENGVYFVTRMKSNAVYEVVEYRDIPENGGVLSDEIIRLTSQKARKECPHLLRRVVYYDSQADREFVFLTNHLEFGSTTIAAIYKDRWQIESFFKTLKQNLKVKTFVGTSPNALKTQIWTALIAMLLLRYLQLRSRLNWHFSNLVALLRWNLFTYRDLWEWIHKPFDTPPQSPIPEQLALSI